MFKIKFQKFKLTTQQEYTYTLHFAKFAFHCLILYSLDINIGYKIEIFSKTFPNILDLL